MTIYENFKNIAIQVIGEKEYLDLFKRHNLDTQKWTKGRVKPFVRDVLVEIRKRTKWEKSNSEN